jgi:Flp pilus assembly secretin CpaC
MRLVATSLSALVLLGFASIDAAMAQTWTGRATPNISNGADKSSKQCGPVNYTLVKDGSQIKIHLDFAELSRDITATAGADGAFSTTYLNVKGNTIHVFGTITGDSGKFNIAPTALCGYKDIPLAH